MTPDVVSAVYMDEYRIAVGFSNGRKGVVDFSSYARQGGVFRQFEDMVFFRSFQIHPELGVLTWGDDVDIAPETLYAAATGEPLPDWMTEPSTPATRQD